MANKKCKEPHLIPGVFEFLTPSDDTNYRSLPAIIRKTMRECGYYCIGCGDVACEPIDVCGSIGGCGSSGISTDAGNCLVLGADNLPYLDCTPFTGGGGGISSDAGNCIILGTDNLPFFDCSAFLTGPLVSADGGNCITAGGDGGAYFDCSGFVSAVSDTGSVNLTLTGSNLSADVIIDPDTTNLIQNSGAGLIVRCETVQDCIGVYLHPSITYNDADPTNIFQVEPSTDAGNCLTYGSDDKLFIDCSNFLTTVAANNGLSGNGTPASPIQLGGTTFLHTTVTAPGVLDLIFNKDNVFIELEGQGLPFGVGEAARIRMENGSMRGQMGVYTNGVGDLQNMGQFFVELTGPQRVHHARFNNSLTRWEAKVNDNAGSNQYQTYVDLNSAVISCNDSAGTPLLGLEIEDLTFGAATPIMKIINHTALPLHATNAAAAGAGLPVGTLYRYDDGTRTHICVVV